ncbi:MAG: ABC transporter ATP-binding protein [Phycisphaeraceae bacterium]|nr:ABC transporter ATP-binding protein [Phycisphaeraceae bacterium]
MSDSSIIVDGVSKQYRIGSNTPHRDVRRMLTWPVRAATALFRSNGHSNDSDAAESSDYIWAVKDVSFEVKRGEVLGIIGRNGAGKSTILRILSRVTDPTHGQCELYGRVGSLLEVGTGFHPELTGRENTYQNAAILGMRAAEVDQRFDAIVAFAEIGKFIDTPVKRYSSGMYTRLAFAVAAHLQPEILIVDEVLAVGDAGFQRKCIQKMAQVAGGGRTVLFVSHNMGSITELCDRVILLKDGRVAMTGDPDDVIRAYLEEGSNEARVVLRDQVRPTYNDGSVRLTFAETRNDDGNLAQAFAHEDNINVRVGVTGDAAREFNVVVSLFNAMGQQLVTYCNADMDSVMTLKQSETVVDLTFRNIFTHGEYYLTIASFDAFLRRQDRADNCLTFQSEGTPFGKKGKNAPVIQPSQWSVVDT